MNSSHREVALALSLSNAFDRKIVAGIARFLNERSRWQIFFESDPANRLPDSRRWSGDGIIADLDDASLARKLPRLKIPVVGIGGAIENPARSKRHYVGIDNHAIGRLGAEHLSACGFRSFGFCGLPRTRTNPWSAIRHEAFRQRLHEEGFDCSIHIGRAQSVTSWRTAQDGLRDWLDSLEKPVAIMASNDTRARHVLEACHRNGLRVPDDVAVLGVDDDELACELGSPPLSSIIQGTDAIGYRAAEMLDTLMDGDKVSERFLTIPPIGIAVRRSTDVLATNVEEVASGVSLIREQLSDIDGQHVAQVLRVSRSKLDRLFEQELGHTVHAQIARERLLAAQRLIAQTDLPLKEIAARSGYRTPQYLSAVFQKETGESPNRFRSRTRADSRRV